jgi:hypothetical protein
MGTSLHSVANLGMKCGSSCIVLWCIVRSIVELRVQPCPENIPPPHTHTHTHTPGLDLGYEGV